jgi:hypothetical protein
VRKVLEMNLTDKRSCAFVLFAGVDCSARAESSNEPHGPVVVVCDAWWIPTESSNNKPLTFASMSLMVMPLGCRWIPLKAESSCEPHTDGRWIPLKAESSFEPLTDR